VDGSVEGLAASLEEVGHRPGVGGGEAKVEVVPGVAVDADGEQVEVRFAQWFGVAERQAGGLAVLGAVTTGGADLEAVLPLDERDLELTPDRLAGGLDRLAAEQSGAVVEQGWPLDAAALVGRLHLQRHLGALHHPCW
jgi:hypothetical protein